MSASTSSLPQGGAPVTANNVKRCKVHHQLVVYSLVSNVFLHYALYGLYRMPQVIDIGLLSARSHGASTPMSRPALPLQGVHT